MTTGASMHRPGRPTGRRRGEPEGEHAQRTLVRRPGADPPDRRDRGGRGLRRARPAPAGRSGRKGARPRGGCPPRRRRRGSAPSPRSWEESGRHNAGTHIVATPQLQERHRGREQEHDRERVAGLEQPVAPGRQPAGCGAPTDPEGHGCTDERQEPVRGCRAPTGPPTRRPHHGPATRGGAQVAQPGKAEQGVAPTPKFESRSDLSDPRTGVAGPTGTQRGGRPAADRSSAAYASGSPSKAPSVPPDSAARSARSASIPAVRSSTSSGGRSPSQARTAPT